MMFVHVILRFGDLKFKKKNKIILINSIGTKICISSSTKSKVPTITIDVIENGMLEN